MVPFGKVTSGRLLSRGSVRHVARVLAGKDYRVVLQQSEPLLLALHFHHGKSVLCLGGEEECDVCFSEGTEARWYAFWACQEMIPSPVGPAVPGRRSVIEVPYSSYVGLQRRLADVGDDPDHIGLEVVFRRAKSIRSPVIVTMVRRWQVDPKDVFDPQQTFQSVVRWLGLPALNCDLEAWKARVKKLVASSDFYASPDPW